MSNRLPDLSYRLAHHFPDALPFIVPFYNKLEDAGFHIDEHHIKPVLRRNGRRIITDYNGSVVVFRLYRQDDPIVTMDLSVLRKKIERVKKVNDYAAVDARIDQLVARLRRATET